MLFAMQSGSSFSTSRGYIDLRFVCRSPADVVNLLKLAEGVFTRTFLIALRDVLQVVAPSLYPATVSKYYAVASEVATMEFVRFQGCLFPRYTVLAYVGQRGEDRIHLYGIYERCETQRCTFSTRIPIPLLVNHILPAHQLRMTLFTPRLKLGHVPVRYSIRTSDLIVCSGAKPREGWY